MPHIYDDVVLTFKNSACRYYTIKEPFIIVVFISLK